MYWILTLWDRLDLAEVELYFQPWKVRERSCCDIDLDSWNVHSRAITFGNWYPQTIKVHCILGMKTSQARPSRALHYPIKEMTQKLGCSRKSRNLSNAFCLRRGYRPKFLCHASKFLVIITTIAFEVAKPRSWIRTVADVNDGWTTRSADALCSFLNIGDLERKLSVFATGPPSRWSRVEISQKLNEVHDYRKENIISHVTPVSPLNAIKSLPNSPIWKNKEWTGHKSQTQKKPQNRSIPGPRPYQWFLHLLKLGALGKGWGQRLLRAKQWRQKCIQLQRKYTQTGYRAACNYFGYIHLRITINC